jgi:hypothetical protein
MNQPSRGPHCWVRTPEFHRCLLRLPPNTPSQGRLARHHVHYSLWLLLLREDVVRVKGCGGHLPALYAVLF